MTLCTQLSLLLLAALPAVLTAIRMRSRNKRLETPANGLDPLGTYGSEALDEHFKAIDSVVSKSKSYYAGVRALKSKKVRPYYVQSQLDAQYQAAAALFQLATGLPSESGASVDEINAALKAENVTYRVTFVEEGDQVNKRNVYVLREIAGETCDPLQKDPNLAPCTFNGALMVADGDAQQLAIESPHRSFDMNTGRQGYWLFVRLNARFWMVNTAHRKHDLVYAEGYGHGWGTCDNPSGNGWGGVHDVSVCDAAHAPKALLHVWHQAFVDAGWKVNRPFYVMQNHGFGANTASFCRCDYQVSDGHGDPNQAWTDELGVVKMATTVLNEWAVRGKFPDPDPNQKVVNGWKAKEWLARSCYGEDVAWHDCPPGPMDLDRNGVPKTCVSNETHIDHQGLVCAKLNPQGQYVNLYDTVARKGPSQYNDQTQTCTLNEQYPNGPGRSSGLFLHIEQSFRARQAKAKSWEGIALAVQTAFDYAAERVEPRLKQ